jgi:hypothetical protein
MAHHAVQQGIGYNGLDGRQPECNHLKMLEK